MKPVSEWLSSRAPVEPPLRAGFDALGWVDDRLEFSRLDPRPPNAVLTYHAVGSPGRYGNVSVERFRRDLRYLTRRFDVVDLPGVLTPGSHGRVAVTFDDAYDDFADNALPVLREFDVPATLFVPAGLVGGGPPELAYRLARSPASFDRFNDPAVHADADVSESGVMSWERLRSVADDELVTVGNHSMTHPDLGQVTDAEALDHEIRDARDRLAAELDVDVDRFCFPFGRHSAAARRVVRESHALSVTTRAGVVFDPAGTDPHFLPRIDAHGPEHEVHWNLSGIRWRLSERVN